MREPASDVGASGVVGRGARRACRRPAGSRPAASSPLGGGRLGAGLFGSLAEVFRDLGHRSAPHHSGPEIPPSLRTRQKWMAMKMTITNGSISTWSTYHRSNVSEPISTPPRSTNRT